jgi:6-pyruvoyl tetrahydropterin synthase.
MNTTAENIVVWIYEKMAEALHKKNLSNDARVEFVRLFETPTSYAEARREWMEIE